MKVRLDFPFAGVLLIIAHLVGETLTYEPVGHLLLYNNNRWVGSFGAILIPTLTFWHLFTSVQCTIEDPAKDMRAFASSQQEKAVQQQRQPKIIKELTLLNRQSCLSKILCGVEVAKPPSSSSSTMNDYAFIVKSFFDVLSLGGRGKKKNANQDDESPESDEEEEDDIESLSGSRRTNSKKPFSSNFGGEPDIEDTYSKDLEDLLKERDGFFKRRGRQYNLTTMENPTNIELDRVARVFFGNPRFDKTAFLNKKQLQIQQAESDQEKLQIASEVANKLQNPRQCRLLSWFRPSYTTTTTITTTSNEPTMSQNTVNSMCPFTVKELQAMIGPAANPQNLQNEEISQNVQNQEQITKIVPLPKYRPKPAYQIFAKPALKTTPIPISVYGESDPDLELIKDPFYSLLPPEYAPPKEQKDEKYGNFYLNADDTVSYKPTQAPKKVINVTTTTTTTTPKPVLTSDEDEEEDDIDDSAEENNEFVEHVQSHPHPQGHKEGAIGMRYMASTVGQSSRIRIQIPSKIHISIPSIRGIAANFKRKDLQKPLNIPNPVDDNSDESPIERRETKRQTNFNHEKQLVFKTNLEFQDTIIDQKAPEFFVSKKKPLGPPPPVPPKSTYDEDDEDSEGEEEEEEEERSNMEPQQKYSDDDSNEETIVQKYETQSQKQSKVTTRRPLLSFSLPSILRSKTTTTTTTTQRPTPTKYSPSKNSTGILRHVLSPHGMRTLSTITSMFYGSKQDEVHPHENAPPPPPPPRRRKKGPKRHRKRRPRPPRPQHDQGDDEEEDDEDEEESDESIETKPTPTSIPPLVPVKMPPRIVAVPIYLEGKEAWEKAQDEEEFFEPKPQNKVKNKPEKYDYEESAETTNSGEGIDFGPGQGIQTEYSEIVDKVKRPGLQNPNSDRYVYGLPTTWEFMYEELKKQKNNKQKNKESGNESDESGESGGNDSKPPPRRKPPPPSNYYNRRPAASHYFPLEPID